MKKRYDKPIIEKIEFLLVDEVLSSGSIGDELSGVGGIIGDGGLLEEED